MKPLLTILTIALTLSLTTASAQWAVDNKENVDLVRNSVLAVVAVEKDAKLAKKLGKEPEELKEYEEGISYFNAAYNTVGAPITSIQIPTSSGGGPTSKPLSKYHWGPSVSWNTYLESWVMLMAKSEGPSWRGGSIYISFNKNSDLGKDDHAQQWTTPSLLVDRPGHIL